MRNKTETLKKYTITQLKKGKKIKKTVILSDTYLTKSLEFLKDNHPVHQQKTWAKKLGYKSKIFPGFAITSIFSNLLGTKLPGIYSVITNLDFSFKKPAYVGDKLIFTCLINKVYREYNLVKLDIFINRKNKKILTGTSICKILK